MGDCTNQAAIHLADEFYRNLLGANCLTFSMIGTVAEGFGLHGNDHAQGARVALRLALGKRVEMCQFGRREEAGGCIWTSRDTSATTDASRRVE